MICISDGLVLLIMHTVFSSWKIITLLFKLMPHWLKHLEGDSRRRKKSRMVNTSINWFSICLLQTRFWHPDTTLTLRLWAKNCDNWLTPKWQSVESQTSTAQSTIIQHAGYRQPARQNVIKTSKSVLQCVWMQLAEETCKSRVLWCRVSHKETCVTFTTRIQQEIIFSPPFDNFRTCFLPESTFCHLLLLSTAEQRFRFVGFFCLYFHVSAGSTLKKRI